MRYSKSRLQAIISAAILLSLSHPPEAVAHLDSDDIIPDRTGVQVTPLNRNNHVGVEVPQNTKVYGTVKPLPQALSAKAQPLNVVSVDAVSAARMKVQAKLITPSKAAGNGVSSVHGQLFGANQNRSKNAVSKSPATK